MAEIEYETVIEVVAGGCIRFDENKPKFHVNTGHATVNMSDVHIDPSGDLKVTLHGVQRVVACIMSPDESMTTAGIDAGMSGGLGSGRIRMYRQDGGDGHALNLAVPAQYDELQGPTTNLWVAIVGEVVREKRVPLSLFRDLEDRVAALEGQTNAGEETP